MSDDGRLENGLLMFSPFTVPVEVGRDFAKGQRGEQGNQPATQPPGGLVVRSARTVKWDPLSLVGFRPCVLRGGDLHARPWYC